MAVVVILDWEGLKAEQYDQVREGVGWLEEPPTGGRVHIAAFSETGGRFTDVWDSAEDFQTFVDTRLMPVVQKVGLEGQPEVQILPLHELFAPRPEQILVS